MAETRIRIGKQLAKSATAGSILITDSSKEAAYLAPPTGDKILYYDDTTSNAPTWLTVGTSLTIAAGVLDTVVGATGYGTIQEEGTALTQRSIINFVGSGFTAADDAGNSRTNVTLDATLNALASFNTNGILTQTAADTFTGRTITGTTNKIDVTNGDGVSGNPTITISGTYVGQSSITTLGTIATGTWNGSTIGATYGGTGLTSYTTGDVIYASATNTLSKRAIGATGNFLRVVAGVPNWATAASTDLSDTANIALLNANQTFSGNNTFSNVIVNNVSPTLGTHLVNKTYVDSLFQGARDFKESVRVASTANVSATYNATGGTSARGQFTSAPNTLNGVTLATDDRLLLNNQSTGAQNGIWVVTTVGTGSNGVWDRATDFDADAEVTSGARTYVSDYVTTDNRGTYILTTNDPITIGGGSGTALTFTQIDSPSGYIGGNGMTLTGMTFDVGTASSSRIVVNADNIDLATTAVSAAAYGSASSVGTFTVDAYGRLTAAASTAISITSSGVSDFVEAAQDAIGTALTDSTTVDFTYNDGANTITAAVISQMSITADASGLKLSGDSSTPGNSKIYGTNGSGTKGWYDSPAVTVTVAYVEGSTASSIDLSVSGSCKDYNGNNTTFSFPSNIESFEVYRNGQRMNITGSLTTRDYSISGTSLVLTTALTSDEVLTLKKTV